VSNRNGAAGGPPAAAISEALEHLGWAQGDLAAMWGVSQGQVSMLIRGYRGITPLVALRLEATVGGSAEAWMDLQRDWDLTTYRQAMADELVEIAARRTG
jgi:addiction module HigA family antidote